MSRRSRYGMIISSGFVALALVAGCSGGTAAPAAPAASAPAQGADATALLEGVPEATFAAGSARFEMQINISGQGQNVTSNATGSYDFTRNIGDLTLEGEPLGLPGTLEAITDGDTVYLRLPGQPNWFRTSAGPGTPGQYDPAQQLELLRDASSDVREVGTEQLRGTEVRHITFTLDVQQLAESQGQAGTAGAVFEPAPADVWIDSDGRARKFQFRVPVQQAGTPIESGVTIEYFDFGIPVTVQAPDPATVQELPTGG